MVNVSMFLDQNTSLLIAASVSGFTVFVTRRDVGKRQFATASIVSWILVLATFLHDQLDAYLPTRNWVLMIMSDRMKP